jgi:prefoldin subunit 5
MAKLSTPAGIVSKIMAALKLGEEGKIGSFFSKIESDFNREIKAIKHNISGFELEHEHSLTSLNDKLEDLKKAVDDAWLDITAERVATNALQDSFKGRYLGNIVDAEDAVTKCEKQIANTIENYNSNIKDLNDQIAKYEARLAKIQG